MLRIDWLPGEPQLTISLRYQHGATQKLRNLSGIKSFEVEGRTFYHLPVEQYPALEKLFPGQIVGPPSWKVLNLTPPPPPQWWQQLLPTLGRQIPGLKVPLFNYQLKGANFAVDRLQQFGLAALFDSMGVGKTPQAIATALAMRDRGYIDGPIIYITLASLRRQTVEEGFGKFTDMVAKAATSNLTPKKREKLYEEFDSLGAMVLGYETVLQDEDKLAQLRPGLVIFDESHKLKNRQSKKYKAYYNLIREWKCPVLLLTGTPAQNRPDELYALFALHPFGQKLLGKVSAFMKDYVRMQFIGRFPEIVGYQNLHKLSDLISPYYLRRELDDPEVAVEVPEVTTIDRWVDPTSEQTILFESLAARQGLLQMELQDHNLTEQRKLEIDNQMNGIRMLLQGASDDPLLFRMSSSKMAKKEIEDLKYEGSPKRDLLIQLLEELTENSKVLVFTQFKTLIELISEDLRNLKIGYVSYTGDESESQRAKAIERLRYDPDTRVMLATDAAAEGLNLQVCSAVIHVDLPWNPKLLEQRNGRVRRPNSTTKRVLVIRLLCRTSIDEQVLRSNDKKRDMADQLISNRLR
jgi:SNF2 family DNA or RNA helicase